MFDNTSSKPRGVVSLLAVLLMAAITAIALGASLIILSELRQASAINQGVVAVYAAEAGLEDGLYTVKLDRERGKTLDQVKTDLTMTANQPLGNAKWTRATINETQFLVPQLSRDQTATVDYFNPDGGTQTCPDGSTNRRSCLESIRITWRDYCPSLSANGFAWLESTMFSFPEGLTFDINDPATYVYKDAKACAITGSTCSPITYSSVVGGDIDPTRSIRFSFRELVPPAGTTDSSSCVVQNMTVTGYTTTDPDAPSAKQVPILGQITVKAIGAFGQTQQGLTASVPWRAPISGLASFVIFSEQDIVK